MNRAPTDTDALIAALAETARSSAPPGEPEPEALLDYLAGNLSPEEEEVLSRQLATSPEAARAFLDLAELEAAGTEAGQSPSEMAVLAGWQGLKRRLPPQAGPWYRRLPPLLSSVAAVLLVSTIGLTFDDGRLRNELNRPHAVQRSLDLLAAPRAGSPSTFEVVPGDRVLLAIEPPEPPEACPAYTAKIRNRETRESFTSDKELVPDDRGILALTWQARPGAFELVLSGCEPRREWVYPFRVRAADGR